MENTHDHVEHIEHTQHAAHAAPFDRNVAMSMAIVAAALACVTLLSHRAHNETLRLQTEANIKHTQASDQWSYFQAKKNRLYQYEVSAELLKAISGASAGAAGEWLAKVEKYKHEADEIEHKAHDLEHEADHLQHEAHHVHERGDRFDLAELGTELALVLCSLAVLTKRPPFWYGGLAAGAVGVALAVYTFFGA